MTKYILVGGADRKYPSYGYAFAKEVFKTIQGPKRVLSCLFAKPRENWEAKYEDLQKWFEASLGSETETELAFPDEFTEQIERADIVYLHGGDDALLAHYLDQISDLSELWAGKIVIGSSAGADYLASKYWTCDWRQVRGGSGLSGVNVITHFESDEYGKADPRGPIDWQAAKQELQQTISHNEQVTLLREGQFIVIEQ